MEYNHKQFEFLSVTRLTRVVELQLKIKSVVIQRRAFSPVILSVLGNNLY